MALCILRTRRDICHLFEGRKHNVEELHDLIDFLARYQVRFLYPNQTVAEACNNLYGDELGDDRMKPTDLVHLEYVLAYDIDYFITTDSVLNEYRVPAMFKLKVLHPKEAIKRFQ